jgi:hypothetical protein
MGSIGYRFSIAQITYSCAQQRDRWAKTWALLAILATRFKSLPKRGELTPDSYTYNPTKLNYQLTIANNAHFPMMRACFPTTQMGAQFFAPIAQFSCSAKYM